MVIIQFLKENELFKGLGDNELARIAELCHIRTLEAGAMYFAQGHKATELHLCRSGKVAVMVRLREPWGIEVTVRMVNGGGIFGWSSLVEPYIYSASAKCVERTEDIFIKAEALIKFFDKNPDVGYVFMRNLASIIASNLTEYRHKLTVEIATDINKKW
ncbi:Crp/Fnr family transcriptional regulator [Chloroflexota bacterium]